MFNIWNYQLFFLSLIYHLKSPAQDVKLRSNNMKIEHTAYVFIDELQSNQSQIIFGRKYENAANFPVIEVTQKRTQEQTVRALLQAVRIDFPHARISTSNGSTFINIP